MTSEQLKDSLVREVLQACTPWTDGEQRERLEASLRMALHSVTLQKEETSLSVSVEDPNEEYLKQFLAIKMVKGLSPKSLNLYASTIRRMFLYTGKFAAEITANDIRYFLAIRKQRDGLSNVTLDNELRNLRTFFATLASEELISRDPTVKIDKVKAERKVKEPFTELEVERLRQACVRPHSGLTDWRRNLAILEILCSTGCRIGELTGIRRGDIDGERIKVLGKGNKERWVYLNPRAQIAVEDYLKHREDSFEWLFPGFDSNPVPTRKKPADRPLEIGSIEAMIRKLGKRAGVEKYHPHRFRRTAATVALRRGMPIEQVSKMLGHEQINTTQIYAITADEDVRDAHRKYLT